MSHWTNEVGRILRAAPDKELAKKAMDALQMAERDLSRWPKLAKSAKLDLSQARVPIAKVLRDAMPLRVVEMRNAAALDWDYLESTAERLMGIHRSALRASVSDEQSVDLMNAMKPMLISARKWSVLRLEPAILAMAARNRRTAQNAVAALSMTLYVMALAALAGDHGLFQDMQAMLAINQRAPIVGRLGASWIVLTA